MDSTIRFNALCGPINNDQYEGQNPEDTNRVDCIFTCQYFLFFCFAELKMKPSMLPEGWISH